MNLLIGAVLVVASILLLPTFIALALGPKYATLTHIIIWLSIIQSLRLLKSGPATICLARGKTSNPLLSNLPRVILLFPAWYITTSIEGLSTVIYFAVIGEAVGALTAFALMRASIGIRLKATFPTLLATAIFYTMTCALALNIGITENQGINENALSTYSQITIILMAAAIFMTTRRIHKKLAKKLKRLI